MGKPGSLDSGQPPTIASSTAQPRTMDQSIEKLLDDRDVAEVLKVSPETPSDWRKSGLGPAYVRIGPRLVRYKRSDVQAFIDAGHQPAAEAA